MYFKLGPNTETILVIFSPKHRGQISGAAITNLTVDHKLPLLWPWELEVEANTEAVPSCKWVHSLPLDHGTTGVFTSSNPVDYIFEPSLVHNLSHLVQTPANVAKVQNESPHKRKVFQPAQSPCSLPIPFHLPLSLSDTFPGVLSWSQSLPHEPSLLHLGPSPGVLSPHEAHVFQAITWPELVLPLLAKMELIMVQVSWLNRAGCSRPLGL